MQRPRPVQVSQLAGGVDICMALMCDDHPMWIGERFDHKVEVREVDEYRQDRQPGESCPIP